MTDLFRCMYCSKFIPADAPWSPSRRIEGQRLHRICSEDIYGLTEPKESNEAVTVCRAATTTRTNESCNNAAEREPRLRTQETNDG